MPHPLTGIDHVYVLVHDLQGSAERYRALGFTVSPRGLHSAAKGSANHTIVFSDDYLELLGFVAHTPDNASRRAALQRDGEALQGIACRVADARQAAAALQALGLTTGPAGDFERPVQLADGSMARAAFTTVALDPADSPVGTCFLCQHHTPESVWREDLMHHANGAVGLGCVIVCAVKPEPVVRGFERLFARSARPERDGCAEIPTGTVPIRVYTPEVLAVRYGTGSVPVTQGARAAGMVVNVRELDNTRALLLANGVPFIDRDTELVVMPEEANGALLVFDLREGGYSL